jgi:transcriptional regulator with XRE-family HTH domain
MTVEGIPEKAARMAAATLAELERLRRERGISKALIERRLGRAKGYASQLFAGRIDFKVDHLLAVLLVLEVEPAAFFAELGKAGRVEAEIVPGLTEERLERTLAGLLDRMGIAPTARRRADKKRAAPTSPKRKAGR